MKYGTRSKIPAVVGMQSLVGIGKSSYPKSFGNYFSFSSTKEDIINMTSVRCVNMWAENLEEVSKRFLKDGLIEGVLFTEERSDGRMNRWFVVDDTRLPSKDWLYSKFCWTGSYVPRDNELIREMYSIHGDPSDELEQFTDPKTYHARRGAEYIERDGMAFVKQTINANPKKLKDDWTIEEAKPIIVIGLDIENEIDSILSDPNFTEDDV